MVFVLFLWVDTHLPISASWKNRKGDTFILENAPQDRDLKELKNGYSEEFNRNGRNFGKTISLLDFELLQWLDQDSL